MEISDRLKRLTDKAKDTAVEHRDELEKGLDKAEQLVDQRTGGQYHEQLEKTKTKADAYVEGLEQQADRAKGS
jgi:F0F1-type ATP synthase membrane subunit b/b'